MTDKMELLKRTRLFVLDMDGTFYLGDRILPGAAEFLQAVKAAGKEYLFFTNNSSRSPRDYMAKLARMGCPITRDEIMTSGDVTIRYLMTHCPDKTVYLVGTPPLMESFAEAGIRLVNEKPDLVVIGFDTTLNQGDVLEIYRTTTDKLAVKRTEDGTEENIFSLLDEDSDLLELAPGDNLLKATADSGETLMQVTVQFYPMVSGILPEVIA